MVAWITLSFAALAALYAPVRGICSWWRSATPYSLDFSVDWLERAETSEGGYTGRGIAYLMDGSGELVVRIHLKRHTTLSDLHFWLVTRLRPTREDLRRFHLWRWEADSPRVCVVDDARPVGRIRYDVVESRVPDEPDEMRPRMLVRRYPRGAPEVFVNFWPPYEWTEGPLLLALTIVGRPGWKGHLLFEGSPFLDKRQVVLKAVQTREHPLEHGADR